MSLLQPVRFGLPALLVILLLGCASSGGRRFQSTTEDALHLAAQAQREAELARMPVWHLSGRIAVAQGRDGGSGRLEWRQEQGRLDVRLRAPVTRQGWRLLGEPGWARIEGLEGGPRQDSDADRLLRDSVGWDIPLAHLRAWMRGARAAGEARIAFGPDGLPLWIMQDGWRIEYRAWQHGPLPLPLRVFASRGEQRLRLQVDAWHAGSRP